MGYFSVVDRVIKELPKIQNSIKAIDQRLPPVPSLPESSFDELSRFLDRKQELENQKRGLEAIIEQNQLRMDAEHALESKDYLLLAKILDKLKEKSEIEIKFKNEIQERITADIQTDNSTNIFQMKGLLEEIGRIDWFNETFSEGTAKHILSHWNGTVSSLEVVLGMLEGDQKVDKIVLEAVSSDLEQKQLDLSTACDYINLCKGFHLSCFEKFAQNHWKHESISIGLDLNTTRNEIIVRAKEIRQRCQILTCKENCVAIVANQAIEQLCKLDPLLKSWKLFGSTLKVIQTISLLNSELDLENTFVTDLEKKCALKMVQSIQIVDNEFKEDAPSPKVIELGEFLFDAVNHLDNYQISSNHWLFLFAEAIVGEMDEVSVKSAE